MERDRNLLNSAMLVDSFELTGISEVIMNYCSHMNLERIKMSIITGKPVSSVYEKKISELGVQLFILPNRKKTPVLYWRELRKVLRNNEFDVIHIHCNSSLIVPELFLSYLARISVRIAHSHNTTCSRPMIHHLMYPFFNKLCTHGLACSQQAGEWLFKKKPFECLPNAFNVKKYRYDEKSRAEARDALRISSDDLLIGHVGRFNNQKNHPFLLDVFCEFAKSNENAVLLLVGKGPDFSKVMTLIEQHPYKERIIVYGESVETDKLYNAMDVYVFPSKHEGLGIVLLEAQINGLLCITSDQVPKEVALSDNIRFLSLDDGVDKWSKQIKATELNKRKSFYEINIDRIQKYDIESKAKTLGDLYESFVK